MKRQLKWSLIALAASILIGPSLFVTEISAILGAGGGDSIDEREYAVWLSVLYPDGPSRAVGKKVLDPRAGLPGSHPERCFEALGVLTLCLEGAEPYPSGQPQVSAEDAERTREAIRDFARKSSGPVEIENRFEGAPELRLATRREMEAIEAPGGDKWGEFRKMFPDAWSLMQVSRVGFSPDGTIAVVYQVAGRGTLASLGGLLVLKASEGGWVLVGRYGSWMT
jgi:hypothetical protein